MGVVAYLKTANRDSDGEAVLTDCNTCITWIYDSSKNDDDTEIKSWLSISVSDLRDRNVLINTLALKIDFDSMSCEAQAASIGTHDLVLATKFTDSNGNT